MTPERLEHLAALAQISLSDSEKESIADELQAMLGYMQVLDALPAAPAQSAAANGNVLREDTVHPSTDVSEITACAAEVQGGCFVVPKAVE